MNPTNKSYVSIQLPLGGHTFSSSDFSRIDVSDDTEILAIVDTYKCAIVPQEILATQNLDSHLSALGIALSSDEVAICSNEDEMIAVMALNRECYNALVAKFQNRLHFTSPLLTTPLPEQGSVLHLSDKNLYVRVVNNGVQLMDVVSVENDADILYILEQINSIHNIYNMYARVEGDTRRLCKLCKKQFKSIEICE